MTEQLQQIRQEFLDVLAQQGAEIQSSDISVALQAGQGIYRISGLGNVVLTVCEEIPGYWELDESLVQRLEDVHQRQGERHWYVLLIVRRDGRGANGYIVPDLTATPVKRPLELADGKYRIYEKRHLDSLRLLLSTEKIADLLLRNKV